MEGLRVVELLAVGLDNRRPTYEMGISEVAAKARLRAINASLSVRCRSEVVAVALRLVLRHRAMVSIDQAMDRSWFAAR